jgi:histidine triad (HIT) family protein
MNGYLFCAILEGREEASFVYRDECVSAFMDIRPINLGHVLIVPNRHASLLEDLVSETGGRLFMMAQRLAAALRSSPLRCDGVNFFLADEAAAHQEVFHVHLHVFPRYRGDGFRIQVGKQYDVPPKRAALESHADVIKKQLHDAAG